MSKHNEAEEIKIEYSNENNAFELNALVGTILDYYEATRGEALESGEEWKALSGEFNLKRGVAVPDDVDEEIKKTFINQVKKFQ